MQYAVIGGLIIIVYLLVSPVLFPEAAKTTTRKPVAKRTVKRGQQLYTEEDRTAKFDPVAAPAKNTFKPIIAKVAKTATTGTQMNTLPPAFAGGEANWVYTGTAEIDGILQALLENKSTGDSVFLRVGDTWKGIYVEEITEDTLVLGSATTGTDYTLSLPTEETTTPTNSLNANAAGGGGNLNGPIGPLTIQPDPNMMQNMGGNGFGNNGNMMGNNNGGNRRRGGRRGG